MVNDDLEIGKHFWKNVSALLTRNGKPAKWLAEQVGVSPAAISKYARGTVPSLSVAVRISQTLDVSLDLLAMAPVEQVLAATATSGNWRDGAARRELEKEAGQGLAHELKLGRLALLARTARMAQDDAVIQQLVRSHPGSMTADELVNTSTSHRIEGALDLPTVMASLTALLSQGLVEEVPGQPMRYRATSRTQEMKWHDVRDTAAHVIKAIRCLSTEVLPALHRSSRDARVQMSRYRIQPGRQAELVRRAVKVLRELRLEFDSGEKGVEFVELHAFALPLATHD